MIEYKEALELLKELIKDYEVLQNYYDELLEEIEYMQETYMQETIELFEVEWSDDD